MPHALPHHVLGTSASAPRTTSAATPPRSACPTADRGLGIVVPGPATSSRRTRSREKGTKVHKISPSRLRAQARLTAYRSVTRPLPPTPHALCLGVYVGNTPTTVRLSSCRPWTGACRPVPATLLPALAGRTLAPDLPTYHPCRPRPARPRAEPQVRRSMRSWQPPRPNPYCPLPHVGCSPTAGRQPLGGPRSGDCDLCRKC